MGLNTSTYVTATTDPVTGGIESAVAGNRDFVADLALSSVLASTSTPVQIYGGGGATEKVAGTITLAAGKVKADSLLRISGLCSFLTPNNAGRAVIVYINNVLVGQSYPTATLGSLHFVHDVWVNPDLSGVSVYTQSLNDVLSPTNGQGAPFTAHTAQRVPITIDLTGVVTIEIRVVPTATDVAELSAWTVERVAPPTQQAALAPSTAVACWGDSLTAGSGASSTQLKSYPGQLLSLLRVGKPAANMGIGGQTCAQILARILADKVRGKQWTCIFQMGRNDVGGASLTSIVTTAVAAAVANLSHVRFLVGSIFSAANETTGTANRIAINAANAALAAAYGAKYIDTQTVLLNGGSEIPISYRASTATTTSTYSSGVTTLTVASATGIVNGQFVSGTGIADQTTITISGTTVTLSAATTGAGSGATLSFVGASEVHLSDAGYAAIAAAYSTALTAQGW